MARKNVKTKLKGVSSFFDGRTKAEVGNHSEVIVREAFLRSVRDVTDSFGLDRYSLERVQGMVSMLEEFINVREELE
jgi:hypothetical protein